jgi:hypothetical protein
MKTSPPKLKPLPKKVVICKACGDSGKNSKGGPCYACQLRRWQNK